MEFEPLFTHDEAADEDLALMHLFVVLFAERDEVVAVVLVKVVDVALFVREHLCLDMVHIFDRFVTQSAFGQEHALVVFAPFLLFEQLQFAVAAAHLLAQIVRLFDEGSVHMERFGELQPVE